MIKLNNIPTLFFSSAIIIGAICSPTNPVFYGLLIITIISSLYIQLKLRSINIENILYIKVILFIILIYIIYDIYIQTNIEVDSLKNRLFFLLIFIVLTLGSLGPAKAISLSSLKRNVLITSSIIFITIISLNHDIISGGISNKLNADVIGGYNFIALVSAILILYAAKLKKEGLINNIIYTYMLISNMYIMLLTTSRQAIIYFIFILVCLAFLNNIKLRTRILMAIFIGSIFIGLYYIGNNSYFNINISRLTTEFTTIDSEAVTSTSERISILKQATDFSNVNEFLFGISSKPEFNILFPPYITQSAHNYYVQLFYSFGIISLLIYLTIYFKNLFITNDLYFKLVLILIALGNCFDSHLYSIQGIAFFSLIPTWTNER